MWGRCQWIPFAQCLLSISFQVLLQQAPDLSGELRSWQTWTGVMLRQQTHQQHDFMPCTIFILFISTLTGSTQTTYGNSTSWKRYCNTLWVFIFAVCKFSQFLWGTFAPQKSTQKINPCVLRITCIYSSMREDWSCTNIHTWIHWMWMSYVILKIM